MDVPEFWNSAGEGLRVAIQSQIAIWAQIFATMEVFSVIKVKKSSCILRNSPKIGAK